MTQRAEWALKVDTLGRSMQVLVHHRSPPSTQDHLANQLEKDQAVRYLPDLIACSGIYKHEL
jgi:hypothetical protein